MIADVVRFVAARLADPTNGVNALRGSVPQPGADGALPAVAVLANEMDDAVTALGPIDPALVAAGPALLISYVGAVVADGDPRTRGTPSQVQVLVRYASSQANPATYARVGWQTLRAATRSLFTLGNTTNPGGAVSTTHHVTLWAPSRIAPYAPPPGSAADAFAPALLVTVPALDAWALGA